MAVLWAIMELRARGVGRDGALRDGLAHLILGARVLLNGERGRLDPGTVDRMLVQVAEGIGFDADVEQFEDEKAKD